MKKHNVRRLLVLVLVVALCLLCGAAAQPNPKEIHIYSADDFVQLSKSCKLDTYSQGKTVYLDSDVDLSGSKFVPIPTFGGTFEGQGHTVSGLELSGDASHMGLFRYVQAAGTVRDLKVTGNIDAAGTLNEIGAIVGTNYGTISGCSFSGTISGQNNVGGIAGTNEGSGMIYNCKTEGSVEGDHYVGGIVGQNVGTISYCSNTTGVNVSASEAVDNVEDLDSLTLPTASDDDDDDIPKKANTSTDVGGICGFSSGVIIGCTNWGGVGFEHVGYNIGGIAGSTSGYLRSNTNEGTILGRKDVGGIAGQVEPYVAVTVSESTKDQLQTQLQDLRTLTDRATADAGGAASTLGSQLAGMGTYLDGAANAANNLRATATIDAGALADGSVTGGADLTVGDASAGIGAAIGAGKDADLTIDTHPLEIGSSTSAGIGAGVGGFVDPSDLSLSGGTDGSGALSASLQMNADASMPELASALSGMGAQMRAIGSQAANLSTTLQNDVQAISDKLGEINDTVFAAMDELENRDLVTDGSQTDPDEHHPRCGARVREYRHGAGRPQRRRHRGRDGPGIQRRPGKRREPEPVLFGAQAVRAARAAAKLRLDRCRHGQEGLRGRHLRPDGPRPCRGLRGLRQRGEPERRLCRRRGGHLQRSH